MGLAIVGLAAAAALLGNQKLMPISQSVIRKDSEKFVPMEADLTFSADENKSFQVFRDFDLNGDGYIAGEEELKKFAEQLNPTADSDDVKDMISGADRNVKGDLPFGVLVMDRLT